MASSPPSAEEDARHRNYYHLCRKLVLCKLLVVATWAVSSSDGGSSFSAATTALERHLPSQRIFRSLLQLDLMLWCGAAALWAWGKIAKPEVVEELLFQPAILPDGRMTSSYRLVAANEYDGDGGGYHDDDDDDKEDEEEGVVVVDAVGGGDNQADDHEEEDADPLNTTVDTIELDGDQGKVDGGGGEQNDTLLKDLGQELSGTSGEFAPVSGAAGRAYDDGKDQPDEEQDKCRVPSVRSVVSAAFDLLLLILVALFLFTVSAAGAFTSSAGSSWHMFSRIAAPTFPLLLFAYLSFVAVVPWKKRSEFWIVISMTTTAPWHPVMFRDGFVGDVLTSSVRPMQDIAFTGFYILSGLRGWWSQQYFVDVIEKQQQSAGTSSTFLDHADASVPQMEKSWLLHTVVLPMCMISPLWWRFLQNMRQCFDEKQRWPYLGNALKYFVAAQVATFGVFHPDQQNTAAFLASFAIATLYQIWWDIFMDWGFFERNGRTGGWRLRRHRLYRSRSFYWVICFINVVLRFCWTLSFLPPRYLNAAGVLKEGFKSDFFLGPAIASAEIVRRTLWGLLRFEWEAAKDTPFDEDDLLHPKRGSAVSFSDQPTKGDMIQDGLELTPMKLGAGGSASTRPRSFALVPSSSPLKFTSDMSSMNDTQILGELCLYSTAFALIGALLAAHRGTM